MKKIIFDLDSTLLFISDDWIKYYQDFSDKYKLNIQPMELYGVIGMIEAEATDIVSKEFFKTSLSKHLNIEVTDEVLNFFLEGYASIPLLNTDMVSDVLEYLSKSYEIYAYSNWFTDNQIKRLKKYNLDGFFDKVYGWDIVPLKPTKEGLLSIIGNDDVKDYVFIGDSIKYDMETPHTIGMDTIFYNRNNIKQDKYREVFDIIELKNIL